MEKQKRLNERQSSPALDAQLCFALYTASARLIRLFGPHLKPLGLTYPQYLAMLVLWEESPRSVGTMAQLLGLDFGALSPLLKRMESRGFVERRRSAEDERRVNVYLTEKGRSSQQLAVKIPDAMGCQMGMPPEFLADLHNAVRKFNHRLENIADDAGAGK